MENQGILTAIIVFSVVLISELALPHLALASPLLVRLLEGKQPACSDVEYLQEVNRVSLEFFNRYLKGLPPASPIATHSYP